MTQLELTYALKQIHQEEDEIHPQATKIIIKKLNKQTKKTCKPNSNKLVPQFGQTEIYNTTPLH